MDENSRSLDFYMWPDVLPFTDHSALTSVQARPYREGNLNRVTVGDAEIVKLPSRDSIDRRRQNDVRAHIACRATRGQGLVLKTATR
jgi:hypothetical protein